MFNIMIQVKLKLLQISWLIPIKSDLATKGPKDDSKAPKMRSWLIPCSHSIPTQPASMAAIVLSIPNISSLNCRISTHHRSTRSITHQHHPSVYKASKTMVNTTTNSQTIKWIINRIWHMIRRGWTSRATLEACYPNRASNNRWGNRLLRASSRWCTRSSKSGTKMACSSSRWWLLDLEGIIMASQQNPFRELVRISSKHCWCLTGWTRCIQFKVDRVVIIKGCQTQHKSLRARFSTIRQATISREETYRTISMN